MSLCMCLDLSDIIYVNVINAYMCVDEYISI